MGYFGGGGWGREVSMAFVRSGACGDEAVVVEAVVNALSGLGSMVKSEAR